MWPFAIGTANRRAARDQALHRRTVPVCSPKLLRGPAGLRSPHDVKNHRLLCTNSTDGWTKWLARAGVVHAFSESRNIL